MLFFYNSLDKDQNECFTNNLNLQLKSARQ